MSHAGFYYRMMQDDVGFIKRKILCLTAKPTKLKLVEASFVHRRMENLLAQLEQGLNGLGHHTPEGMTVIRAVMAEIEPGMDTHFACEEQILFPAVSPYHPMVLMEAEHEELMALRRDVMSVMGQVALTDADISRFQAIGARFISNMLDHIGREDAGIFPTCERALSNDEKRDVIEGMAKLRNELKP